MSRIRALLERLLLRPVDKTFHPYSIYTTDGTFGEVVDDYIAQGVDHRARIVAEQLLARCFNTREISLFYAEWIWLPLPHNEGSSPVLAFVYGKESKFGGTIGAGYAVYDCPIKERKPCNTEHVSAGVKEALKKISFSGINRTPHTHLKHRSSGSKT